MGIQRFQQLEAWQYAHKLVLSVYGGTRCLPADERFGLTLQMRRAAVSVPANIAEGFKRRTTKDKVHFYNMSESSLEELKYYVILCGDLGYWKADQVDQASSQAEQVNRLLGGLIRAMCAK
jgi:four helix bundle protein